MTEQQLDAEASRYEPDEVGYRDFWFWRYAIPTKHDVPRRIWACMQGTEMIGGECRRYPTREAAFADLRNAIRLTGTNAAQE